MAVLMVNHKKGTLALKCERSQSRKAKSITGSRWSQASKAWEYNPDRRVVERLMQLFGSNLTISVEVGTLLDETEQHNLQRIELKNLEDAGNFTVPFARQLRNYQRVGANFLIKTKKSILADDMGTGKTLQTITACEELGAERVIVVCPNSLKWNWVDEIKKWTDSAVTYVGGKKEDRVEAIENFEGKYLVINYEAIRLHPELAKMKWDVAVYDEAHKLKNRNTKQTKSAKKIKADNTFLLTGTPMLNRADELWSLLNMLNPKKYSSYWRFVECYCQTYHNGFGKEILSGNPTQQKELRRELSPIMIRRTKDEVLPELPEKIRTRKLVELGDEQKRVYETMEKEAIVEFSGGNIVVAPVVIAQITRLRQIAVSPQLLDHGTQKSAKFDTLMDIIEELKDEHKVVVFSQFRQAIEKFSERLDDAGIGWVSVTGTVSQDDRREATRKIQEDDETRVMLATIEASAHGFTWTSADTAVFLDRHWTPAINKQAEDRIHRIGQNNSVNIINLVAKDTVEERMEKLLERKETDVNNIIEGGLTAEDMKELFPGM